MIYFVATPIGNLKDITLRAIETLEKVDIIACEDTRNSLKLLNHFNIKKKLITYHKFNERDSANGIIALSQSGKDIAVISDAGMPLISDPGQILVQRLKEENIAYTVIGGVNAGLCALLLSGLDTSKFTFIGFLPETKRQVFLKEYKNYSTTLIFYISPHSLKKDIEDVFNVLGARRTCLVKEISKIHESSFQFVLGESIQIEAIGEYVLVVEGLKECKNSLNDLSIEEHIEFYVDSGLNKKEAIKKVAKDRALSKSEIYKYTI